MGNTIFPRDRSKITCLIHGTGHYSEKFKVLNEFGTRYAAIRPLK